MPLSLTGTLSPPALPPLDDGAPRLSVSLIGHEGDDHQLLGTCGGQCTGAPVPFTLTLDPTAAQRFTTFTLEARCTVGLGEEAIIAQFLDTYALERLGQAESFDLVLNPTDTAPEAAAPQPGSFIVLEGGVSIPAELRQAQAYLDCTLLLIQEDGYSNRYSSNIAEHSAYLEGDQATFALTVDLAALPSDSRCKLHIGLYSLDRTQLYAGTVLRDIDLNAVPDLSALTLRKPRRRP